MNIEFAISQVEKELEVATTKFGSFASPHEGIGIILEEYEELKKEVFKQFDARDTGKMRKEARHLAAMATRFMVDLT